MMLAPLSVQCHRCRTPMVPLINTLAAAPTRPQTGGDLRDYAGNAIEDAAYYSTPTWGGPSFFYYQSDFVVIAWVFALLRILVEGFIRCLIFLTGGAVLRWRRARMNRVFVKYPNSLICPRCRHLERRY